MLDKMLAILRYEDLQNLFKISRSSINRWEKNNIFPKRIKIGVSGIGWKREEIKKWFDERNKTNGDSL